MKITQFKLIALLLCIVILLSGCGVIEITDNNRSSASIDPDDPMNRTLFNEWTPLTFNGGQAFSYNFEIDSSQYKVNGNFTFSVKGSNQARLRFDWQFTIGNETDNGNFRGSSEDFIEKLKEYCNESAVRAMVCEAIFSPYEGATLYNQIIADDQAIELGMKWNTKYQGQTYEHELLSVDSYGSIDGFLVSSSVNGVPTQIICISPFVPLPTMTLFLMENNSGEPVDIVCELFGAILN